MKKVITLVVALFALLLLTLTCPDKQAHAEAIKSLVSKTIDARMTDQKESSNVGTFLYTLLASKMTEVFTDTSLSVDNYILFSVGKVTLGGKTHTVSIGVLNHVFTASEDDVLQSIEEGDDL